MKQLLVAFLVTWDVAGFSLNQCSDPKQMDPAVGLCVNTLNLNRSAAFKTKDEADKVAAALKKSATPAYKITNVHEYTATDK